MFGFAIKPRLCQQAKTEAELYAKTEAESDWQRQDVIKFDSEEKASEKMDAARDIKAKQRARQEEEEEALAFIMAGEDRFEFFYYNGVPISWEQAEDMLAKDKSEAGELQQHDQDLSDKFEEPSNEFEVIFYNGVPTGVISQGDMMKLRAVQRQNFGKLDFNAKIGIIKQLENTKAEDDMEELEYELESKLQSEPEEKKMTDFGMLGYNAKVIKVTKVLNEAEDMTADFFKTNAEKEPELKSEQEEKKTPDFGILNYKAEFSKGNTEKLTSELESELEEKKP